MKSVLGVLFGVAFVIGTGLGPSAGIAQTDDAEEISGQDAQDDADPMGEALEVLTEEEEPPLDWEEPAADGGDMHDDPAEGPVILVPESPE